MMKKAIAPFIHALFLIPLLTIAMGAIELIAKHFDLVPDYFDVYRMPQVFLIAGTIICAGIPLFLLANRMIKALEKWKDPSINDHLRHSIFYYFIIVFCLLNWFLVGFNGNISDVYFLTGVSISLISICVNYWALFYSKRDT